MDGPTICSAAASKHVNRDEVKSLRLNWLEGVEATATRREAMERTSIMWVPISVIKACADRTVVEVILRVAVGKHNEYREPSHVGRTRKECYGTSRGCYVWVMRRQAAGLPWIFSFARAFEFASVHSRQPAGANSNRMFRAIESSKIIVPMVNRAAKATEQACVWRAGRRPIGRFPRP